MPRFLPCCLALFALGMPGAEALAAGDSVTVPAQRFTFLSTGSAVEDGWNLSSNGHGLCGFDFASNGAYTIVVGARGQPMRGQWPEMVVRLDEHKILDVAVDQPEWTPYSATIDAAAGHHDVSVYFINDDASSNEDRNLYLKYLTVISLDGTAVSDAQSPEDYLRARATLRERMLDEARTRIESTREGPVDVSVVDADGNPVPGAHVAVRQVRHEFQFGAALASTMFSADSPETETQRYLAEARRLFNCAVPENAMKWPDIQPTQREHRYDVLDRMVNWCSVNDMPLRGHCLVWECEPCLPDWVKLLPDDELRFALHERVKSIVTRYKGRIDEFDVDNEMLHCDYLARRLGPAVRQDMFLDARAANPRAALYVNDYGIVEGGRLDEYIDQIRGLISVGVPVGGIGIQLHLTGDVDVIEFNRALDALSDFKLPIKITEYDCSSNDEQTQARALEHVYCIAFAHPCVAGILLWGFWEKAHVRPEAAMLRADFSQKPAAVVYEDLVFNKWWTSETGTTDAAGHYSCRAFFGDLEVTVASGTSTREWPVHLSRTAGRADVIATFPQPAL